MAPDQLANELRRIASKIDNSKQPSRALVAEAIREIIAKLDPKDYENITDQSVRIDDQMEVHDAMAIQKLEKAIGDAMAALEDIKSAAA